MEDSNTSQLAEGFTSLGITEPYFPPSLKSILNNITRIITTPLSTDNYPIWRSQVFKLLKANEYDGFLDGTKCCPQQFLDSANGQQSINPAYRAWTLLDQNLSSAICSTITPTILPHVINLSSTHDIWITLEKRLQAANRSRLLQLKSELNTVSMKDQSLSQYLTHIKSIADSLTAAGAHVDAEDIILSTLKFLHNITPISIQQLSYLTSHIFISHCTRAYPTLSLYFPFYFHFYSTSSSYDHSHQNRLSQTQNSL